jgi:hypothetical protein
MLSQAWHPLINIPKRVKQHSDEWVQRDLHTFPIMMKAKLVSETLAFYPQLTRLVAQE